MPTMKSPSHPGIEIAGRAVTLCRIDPHGEEPIRGELLNPDDLQECARQLARESIVAPPTRGASLLARLRDNARILRQAHASMADAYQRREPVGIDAEWLIDNYHIVAEAVRAVRVDLPRKYYRELPKLASGPQKG